MKNMNIKEGRGQCDKEHFQAFGIKNVVVYKK